jgi:glutathione S-transferase
MTLKLCGFSASNYYNKIKLQLLEKGVAFEEELVYTGSTHPKLVGRSPMGKVPFLDTPQGAISESIVCAEYIEQTYPEHPLLPDNPFEAAKVREFITHLELDLELVARVLHMEALWGGKVGDSVKERQRKLLDKGIAALAPLTKFSPFVLGDTFTLADCAAAVHMPLIGMTTKIIYGEDLLAAAVPYKDYTKRLAERPAMAKVNADRKENTEVFTAKVRAMVEAGKAAAAAKAGA